MDAAAGVPLALHLDRMLCGCPGWRRIGAKKPQRFGWYCLTDHRLHFGQSRISAGNVGGQIGCDYQFAPNWIVGIEGTATGGNIGGNTNVVQPGNSRRRSNFNVRTDFLAHNRACWLCLGRWLLYAKGGAAWAGDRYRARGHFLGPRLILKDRRRGSAGLQARASNGHSQTIGRSSSNTITTALVRAASPSLITSAAHRYRGHQTEYSGYPARCEFPRLG